MPKIPFNKPYSVGYELDYIQQAIDGFGLAGNGPFTDRCNQLIQSSLSINDVFLTHSCTSALEMAALIYDFKKNDEFILPSYTFVSTANAFVRNGSTPVFIDINPKTLNLDESLVEQAITDKTKAIIPVHYAGISCDMDQIIYLAKKYNLLVIEDAAQAYKSSYKGNFLGSFGNVSAFSFHETKNIISGEGGALILNDSSKKEIAEIIWEKGTNRRQFFQGLVDKYTWHSIGSSFLPGEIIAAFLCAQLENTEDIINQRLKIWEYYYENLIFLEKQGLIRLPFIPEYNKHNAHIFYLIIEDNFFNRNDLIKYLADEEIMATFHYIPLHSSPGGVNYGRVASDMKYTDHISNSLIRLPLWLGMTKDQQNVIIERIINFFSQNVKR